MSYSEVIVKGIELEHKSSSFEENMIEDKRAERLHAVQRESNISTVQELFPALGEGFVIECLRFYDESSERVINAILEDNLPDFLKSLSHSLDRDDIEEFPTINQVEKSLHESPLKLNLEAAIKAGNAKCKKSKPRKQHKHPKLETIEKDLDTVQKVKAVSQRYNSEQPFRSDPFHAFSEEDVTREGLPLSKDTMHLNECLSDQFDSKWKRNLSQEETNRPDGRDDEDNKFINPERRINTTHCKQVAYKEKCQRFITNETKRRKERTLSNSEKESC